MQHRGWTDNIFRSKSQQQLSFRVLVRPLSWLFLAAVRLRTRAYRTGLLRTQRLPGICISVGNIALGGTGKTPLVIALAQFLRGKGHRPLILSRGYGSSLAAGEFALLRAGAVRASTASSPLRHADEGMLQSHQLPEVAIVLGGNRFNAAQWYLSLPGQEAPSHWLLDDGFQHQQLARDLDLVLLDYKRPLGSQQLLPLGTLREPPEALGRASALLITRSPRRQLAPEFLAALPCAPSLPVRAVPFRTLAPRPLAESRAAHGGLNFARARFLAVAGIAQPADFIEALAEHGIYPREQLIVPDHAPLDPARLRSLSAHCEAVVTTAKDYYRDPEVFLRCHKPVYVVDLIAELPTDELETLFPRIFA